MKGKLASISLKGLLCSAAEQQTRPKRADSAAEQQQIRLFGSKTNYTPGSDRLLDPDFITDDHGRIQCLPLHKEIHITMC